MLIFAMMLFMLLVMIFLLFFFLTSIPYVVAVYESDGEVVKFNTAAAHKVNVVGKLEA